MPKNKKKEISSPAKVFHTTSLDHTQSKMDSDIISNLKTLTDSVNEMKTFMAGLHSDMKEI